jgi:DNA-directed RNA polymerase II subunit RPB1
VTLTYHHAIFSNRCTSSSLKCPYNIEQSAILSPVYGSAYEITTQGYTSSPPTSEPTPEFYKPASKVYGSLPTAVEFIPKIYVPSPPPYQPAPETHETSSPKYETTSQIHKTPTPTNVPTPNTYKPSTTTYKPTSHTYRPSPPDHKTTQLEEAKVSQGVTGKVTSIMNVFRLCQK